MKRWVGSESCPAESRPLRFLANKKEINKGRQEKTFKIGVRTFVVEICSWAGWPLEMELFRGLRTGIPGNNGTT